MCVCFIFVNNIYFFFKAMPAQNKGKTQKQKAKLLWLKMFCEIYFESVGVLIRKIFVINMKKQFCKFFLGLYIIQSNTTTHTCAQGTYSWDESNWEDRKANIASETGQTYEERWEEKKQFVSDHYGKQCEARDRRANSRRRLQTPYFQKILDFEEIK